MCLCEILPVQHLDISDDKQFTSDVARQLLGQPGILPALVSLDVSGRKQVCVCVCICVDYKESIQTIEPSCNFVRVNVAGDRCSC